MMPLATDHDMYLLHSDQWLEELSVKLVLYTITRLMYHGNWYISYLTEQC